MDFTKPCKIATFSTGGSPDDVVAQVALTLARLRDDDARRLATDLLAVGLDVDAIDDAVAFLHERHNAAHQRALDAVRAVVTRDQGDDQ